MSEQIRSAGWKAWEISDQVGGCLYCFILVTDHSCFDYPIIQKYGKLIVDTRNAFNETVCAKIIKA